MTFSQMWTLLENTSKRARLYRGQGLDPRPTWQLFYLFICFLLKKKNEKPMHHLPF
jgi:hypothetical protein